MKGRNETKELVNLKPGVLGKKKKGKASVRNRPGPNGRNPRTWYLAGSSKEAGKSRRRATYMTITKKQKRNKKERKQGGRESKPRS